MPVRRQPIEVSTQKSGFMRHSKHAAKDINLTNHRGFVSTLVNNNTIKRTMKVTSVVLIAMFVGAEAFAPVPARQTTFTSTSLEMAPRNDPPTAATGVKAVGFLGAAAAILGLIVTAPFADVGSPGAMPSVGLPNAPKLEIVKKNPAVTAAKAKKEKQKSELKVTKALKSQGYDF